jgi:hypothetical protein
VYIYHLLPFNYFKFMIQKNGKTHQIIHRDAEFSVFNF